MRRIGTAGVLAVGAVLAVGGAVLGMALQAEYTEQPPGLPLEAEHTEQPRGLAFTEWLRNHPRDGQCSGHPEYWRCVANMEKYAAYTECAELHPFGSHAYKSCIYQIKGEIEYKYLMQVGWRAVLA